MEHTFISLYTHANVHANFFFLHPFFFHVSRYDARPAWTLHYSPEIPALTKSIVYPRLKNTDFASSMHVHSVFPHMLSTR